MKYIVGQITLFHNSSSYLGSYSRGFLPLFHTLVVPAQRKRRDPHNERDWTLGKQELSVQAKPLSLFLSPCVTLNPLTLAQTQTQLKHAGSGGGPHSL